MENELNEMERIVDTSYIKREIIRLAIVKHTGKEPDIQLLNKVSKYLEMEYENNTSKNSLDNRINSICKVIEKKFDKYLQITTF